MSGPPHPSGLRAVVFQNEVEAEERVVTDAEQLDHEHLDRDAGCFLPICARIARLTAVVRLSAQAMTGLECLDSSRNFKR